MFVLLSASVVAGIRDVDVVFVSGSLVGVNFVAVCMAVLLSGSKVVGVKDFEVWVLVLGWGADAEIKVAPTSLVVLE